MERWLETNGMKLVKESCGGKEKQREKEGEKKKKAIDNR